MMLTLAAKGVLCLAFLAAVLSEKDDKDAWKKKDIRDYSDADLEKLLDQWEEDEEPLPVDELPEWDPRRPQPQLDLNDMSKYKNPEELMKMSKKGKSLMLFARVTGNPSKDEAETITSIWQTGLWNSHIQTDRFMVEDDRVIFMFKDGSVAWEAKDYLIEQERCADVQLEQNTYYGLHTEKGREQAKEKKQKSNKKSNKKKKKKQPKSEL